MVLPLLNGWEDDSARTTALRDMTLPARPMLRSPLGTVDLRSPDTQANAFRLIVPQVAWTYNAAIPQSANDGGMWAGKGSNLYAMTGIIASRGRWLVVLAPEITLSSNRFFDYVPLYIVPPDRRPSNPFNSPFHGGPATIDLPFRFGEESVVQTSFGQSSIALSLGPVRASLSTENHWWGPGVRNAILLSNNASGFPHLGLASARPVSTRAGFFEWRWMVGGLSESQYYDTVAANDLRSFSAAAVTWTPWAAPGLSLGLARAVYAPVSRWLGVPARLFDVLTSVGRPNDLPASDTTRRRGRDQLVSVFARLRLPADGAEVYGEWARSAEPKSLRDLLADPAHSQGYTVGLRWLGVNRGSGTLSGALSLEAELTNLEVGGSVTRRPTSSFYLSRAVEQGYTHRGQVIGAAIGPGGSSQWLAADWVGRGWKAGVTAQRVRWENDAYFDFVPRITPPDNAWCQHDVTLAPGVRASVETSIGRLGATATAGKRYNMFFTHALYCPSTGVGREESAASLSVSYTIRPR